MKRLPETDEIARRRSINEAGFSLLPPLIFVLLIAFIAAAAMHLMRYRYALLGFVVAVFLAVLIASLPDMKRYIKISSM